MKTLKLTSFTTRFKNGERVQIPNGAIIQVEDSIAEDLIEKGLAQEFDGEQSIIADDNEVAKKYMPIQGYINGEGFTLTGFDSGYEYQVYVFPGWEKHRFYTASSNKTTTFNLGSTNEWYFANSYDSERLSLKGDRTQIYSDGRKGSGWFSINNADIDIGSANKSINNGFSTGALRLKINPDRIYIQDLNTNIKYFETGSEGTTIQSKDSPIEFIRVPSKEESTDPDITFKISLKQDEINQTQAIISSVDYKDTNNNRTTNQVLADGHYYVGYHEQIGNMSYDSGLQLNNQWYGQVGLSSQIHNTTEEDDYGAILSLWPAYHGVHLEQTSSKFQAAFPKNTFELNNGGVILNSSSETYGSTSAKFRSTGMEMVVGNSEDGVTTFELTPNSGGLSFESADQNVQTGIGITQNGIISFGAASLDSTNAPPVSASGMIMPGQIGFSIMDPTNPSNTVSLSLDPNGVEIKKLKTPTEDADAANKKYVDDLIATLTARIEALENK